MSNLLKHAKNEFRAAGWTDDQGNFNDPMQEAICEGVLDLITRFADQGHSGTSAPYSIELFKKLASYEPIVPLTGEDWEWHEPSPGVFQNTRCSHVFRQGDRFGGQAYDIQGKVFYEWVVDKETGERHKSSFTSMGSLTPVTFPYTPKIEYVEVTRGEGEGE